MSNKAKALNATHDKFEVRVFSFLKNAFIPRLKDAVHSTFEGAEAVTSGLKVLPWEIAGHSIKHKQFHTVAIGKPQGG